ncbi:zinc ribbon domain-containing protein [Tyzzerella sp. OttesenSCG-928-J15]|nr:zinc ribbon domain-containing protein [Tyzzerella sp. OttesenSCG-928-J15]
MPQRVLKTYYDSLENNKIMATKCPSCGQVEWPPMPTCNNCGSIDMEWITIKGEAIIDDIQPVSEAMSFGLVEKYWPYYLMVGRLAEGTDISGMVFGITEENEADVRAKLPCSAKAELLELEGFKTVAWRIV